MKANKDHLVAASSTPLEMLKPAPWNPRTIKDERFQNLVRSIEADPEFLWRRPILAAADGTIYAGNMRYRAAVHLGMDAVPAVVEEVDEKLAKERALRDNAQWGDWQEDQLAEMVFGLKADGSDIDLLGIETKDLERLLSLAGTGSEGLSDPDDVPEAPNNPVTQPGDLWVLGKHRLLCGDSTDAPSFERLMQSQKAEMVWTDPPYGVAIGDKNKFLNSIARSNRVEENLKNDTLNDAELSSMLALAFGNAAERCEKGGAWYVAAPAGPLHVTFGFVLKEMGIWHQTIQWVKNNATFSPMGVDYHWQAEPIFYGWLPGAAHRYYGGRKQTTVWEIARPAASPDHPTMKPVELVARAIENSSTTGQIVLDMFLGSGTTLIASEQLGRVCYGVELDPMYCDVIVKRWEDFTGRKAERA